jgi:hypothetical protein
MQKLLFFLFSLSLTTIVHAQTQRPAFSYERSDSIKNVLCKVDKIVDLYVLTPIDQPNKRYSPANLDDKYKAIGLTVTVSGVVGKPPMNARMIGIPFFVTYVKEEKPTEPSIINRSTGQIDVYQQTGVVKKIGNDYIVQLPDGTKFAPTKMKKKYRKEGTKVSITGTAQPILPDSRQSFYPIELKSIKKN